MNQRVTEKAEWAHHIHEVWRWWRSGTIRVALPEHQSQCIKYNPGWKHLLSIYIQTAKSNSAKCDSVGRTNKVEGQNEGVTQIPGSWRIWKVRRMWKRQGQKTTVTHGTTRTPSEQVCAHAHTRTCAHTHKIISIPALRYFTCSVNIKYTKIW